MITTLLVGLASLAVSTCASAAIFASLPKRPAERASGSTGRRLLD